MSKRREMSEELDDFLQFIDDISEMNVERDWRLIAPRLQELGKRYIAALPWHKRLRFHVRAEISSAWLWFDWWVIIRATSFVRVLKRWLTP